MSIRPIDMQTLLPKTQEHKQSRDQTIKQPDNAQQSINVKNKAVIESKLRQVVKTENEQQVKIRDDEERKRRERENSGAKKTKSVSEEPDGTEKTEEEKKEELQRASEKLKRLQSLRYHKFDMKV